MHKQLTILHDCGIAPGLSHLVAGRAIRRGYNEVGIYVGGVSAYSEDDYVITWSPEDLLEEYTRPARIVESGQIKKVPALSGLGPINIPGVSREMEFSVIGSMFALPALSCSITFGFRSTTAASISFALLTLACLRMALRIRIPRILKMDVADFAVAAISG